MRFIFFLAVVLCFTVSCDHKNNVSNVPNTVIDTITVTDTIIVLDTSNLHADIINDDLPIIDGDLLEKELENYLGRPYLWGRDDIVGGDCSGSLHYILEVCGYNFPRITSKEMFLTLGKPAGDDWQDGEKYDLIWWSFTPDRPYGHIGIMYTSKIFFNASSSKGKFTVASLTDSDVYRNKFAGYKKLFYVQ